MTDPVAPDAERIAAALPQWTLVFPEPGSPDAGAVPPAWAPVLNAGSPAERRAAALALWPGDMLALLPGFATVLRERLLDVRVAQTDDTWALVYATAGDNGLVCWVGYDPRDFGDDPPWFETIHPVLQQFLREVHAGFVAHDREQYGPTRPRHMATIAVLAGFPEGIPDWVEEDEDIDSTRLLRITSNSGNLLYCASPDLDPTEVALVYEGDIDPKDLGEELDKLMARAYY